MMLREDHFPDNPLELFSDWHEEAGRELLYQASDTLFQGFYR